MDRQLPSRIAAVLVICLCWSTITGAAVLYSEAQSLARSQEDTPPAVLIHFFKWVVSPLYDLRHGSGASHNPNPAQFAGFFGWLLLAIVVGSLMVQGIAIAWLMKRRDN